MNEDLGSSSTPIPMTILTTMSVKINGDQYLTPTHSSGAAIIASGDMMLNGNPSTSASNYEGIFCAGAQCRLNGNPNLEGMLPCADNPNPSGALRYTDENILNGDANIIYNCGLSLVNDPVVPIRERAWGEVLN